MPADSFESPLTLAACGGHVELAALLIERGANLEEVNDEGYTPLMEAAREGHEEMVALLLGQGNFKSLINKLIPILKVSEYLETYLLGNIFSRLTCSTDLPKSQHDLCCIPHESFQGKRRSQGKRTFVPLPQDKVSLQPL